MTDGALGASATFAKVSRERTLNQAMHVRSLGGFVLLLVVACDPAPPADTGSCDEGGAADPLNVDLTMPAVSFASDTVPILQASCSIAGATCHGDPSVTAQGRPFLGDPDGGTSTADIRKAVVGVMSSEDPKLVLVAPASLDQSFLWQKVNNTQCRFASDCAAGTSAYPTCGLPMPYGNMALPDDQLNTIARWIAQGAKDD